MPNWITNTITMRGDGETIKTIFNRHFEDGTFDFNTITPQPQTIKECPKEYICDCKEEHLEPEDGKPWFNWYEWNYDNWGVKWNACEGWVNAELKMFGFDTPWGMPATVMAKMSRLYPNIVFEIEVTGEIDLPYRLHIQNGKEIFYEEFEENWED